MVPFLHSTPLPDSICLCRLPFLVPVLPVPLALPLPSPLQPCPLLLPPLLVSPPAPRLSSLWSVRSLCYFTSSLRQNFRFCPPFPRRGSGHPLPYTALQAQGPHFCLLSSSKRLEPSKETLCPLGLASRGSWDWNACSRNLQPWVPASGDSGQEPGVRARGLPQVISPAQD